MRTTCHFRILRIGLLFLLALPAAVAQDDWRTASREPTFEAGPASFHYVAAHEQAAGRDWVEADFTLENLMLHYGFTSTGPDAPASVDVDVALLSLVEFIDDDADQALGVGDRIVQKVDLPGRPLATLVTDSHSPVSYEATATVPLPAASDGHLPLGSAESGAGRLVLRITFAPQPWSAEGRTMMPTELRYDVRIEGFPYEENETRLALVARISSLDPTTQSADGIAARDEPFVVEHRWMREATVNGDRRPLAITFVQSDPLPTVPRPSESRIAYLALPHARDARMEAVFGIERAPSDAASTVLREILGDGRLFLSGLALFGLAVAGATLLRLRRG